MSRGLDRRSGGSYLLWIAVARALTFRPGAGAEGRLGRGGYCYVGSARRGLLARVARHLRRRTGAPQVLLPCLLRRASPGAVTGLSSAKRLRWHVDYLLERPEVAVRGVTLLLDAAAQLECPAVRLLLDGAGARIPLPGFGSSDCRAGCGAHLLALPRGRHLAARRLVEGLAPGRALHLGR